MSSAFNDSHLNLQHNNMSLLNVDSTFSETSHNYPANTATTNPNSPSSSNPRRSRLDMNHMNMHVISNRTSTWIDSPYSPSTETSNSVRLPEYLYTKSPITAQEDRARLKAIMIARRKVGSPLKSKFN